MQRENVQEICSKLKMYHKFSTESAGGTACSLDCGR